MATMADMGILSTESSFEAAPTDASSHVASMSSTPPTTVSPDSISLASEADAPKSEMVMTPFLAAAAAAAAGIDADTVTVAIADVAQTVVDSIQASNAHAHDASRRPSPFSDAIAVATPLPASPERDDSTVADAPSSGRPRRNRKSEPVYNLSKLAGTDQHGKRRANGDIVRDKTRRSASGVVSAAAGGSKSAVSLSTDQLMQDSIDALDMAWSINTPATPKGLRLPKKSKSAATLAAAPPQSRATRQSGTQTQTLATKLSTLGKRGRKTFEKGLNRMSRELRRLQDTNEFAHIDEKPIRYTVWSNGKYMDADELEAAEAARAEPPAKKAKVEEGTVDGKDVYEIEEDAKPAAPTVRPKRVKKWLDKGLYAGQEAPPDASKGLTAQEKKTLLANPDLVLQGPPNKVLPMPIFTGLRQILNGRDFKLPFNVLNPLPPGQARPPAYRTITKSKSPPLHTYTCTDTPCMSAPPSRVEEQKGRVYILTFPLRSVHRRCFWHLEEVAVFPGFLNMHLQARGWLRRGLPESHHALRV